MGWFKPMSVEDTMRRIKFIGTDRRYVVNAIYATTCRLLSLRTYLLTYLLVNVESASDRSETHALVNNNNQASPKGILIQLSIRASRSLTILNAPSG